MEKYVSQNKKDIMVLIDGNSLLNRAYFATRLFSTKDGFPTNGIFGFLKLLLKINSDIRPEYMVVAFDLHAPTFRHKMFDAYKAGRKPMADELRVQVPVLKDCLKAMNVSICEKEGFEADDIIGTLSRAYDVHTVIYTGDRDSYQLVNENTDVHFTRKGVSDILQLTDENFYENTNLRPSQIIDLKSLMGDKSDNIPGVTGVGEKTAMELLAKYDNLENIYAHLDEITGAVHKKLSDCKEQAFLSKTLATIDVNVPLDLKLSDCVMPKTFSAETKQKFAQLEFRTLLSMDIYEEEETQPVSEPTEKGKETTIITYSQEGFEEIYQKIKGKKNIVVDYSKDFRIFFDSTEYIFPIKENFFDSGYFIDALVPLFKVLFEDDSKTFIFYKSKDFFHFLKSQDVAVTCSFEDVSLMKYLVDYTGKDDDLDYLITYYHLPEEKRAYSLFEIFNLYTQKLTEENSMHLYKEIELPLVSVLYSMEEEGVCVKEEMLSDFSKKYDGELSVLSEEIYALAGENFNINSPSQMGEILFNKLNLGTGKKSKTGKFSTSADVLEKLAEDNEIVRKILRFRQIQKLKSTYIEGIRPLIQNGKVHTTYNQVVTATGRLSSANPNMQNIPVRNVEGKELRKLFVASEGNILLDADYSQIELRLLAHFSGCKELIQAYNNGEDIHALTASQVFNVPLNEVTPTMRRNAKAVNFGIIYGISAFGLSQDLGISVSAAQNYINKYFEHYSDVKKYMDENVAKAKKDGFITTFTGRRRVINELKSSNFNVRSFGERAAMNMPLQGSSADIIKIAMINVYRRLNEKKLKAKLILQVHDELVIDCPVEEKEIASQILKEEMEHAVTLLVPLTVEVCSGNNWFEAK